MALFIWFDGRENKRGQAVVKFALDTSYALSDEFLLQRPNAEYCPELTSRSAWIVDQRKMFGLAF
jgi:hypothetical protein